MKERRTNGMVLYFGARPWYDASAAASNANPAAACAASAHALLLVFSGEDAQHSSILLRARLAALVVVSLGPVEEGCAGGRLLSLVRSRGAKY